MQNSKSHQVFEKSLQKMKQSFRFTLSHIYKFLKVPQRFYNKYPKLSVTLLSASLLITGFSYGLISKQQSLLYFPSIGWGRSNESNPLNLKHPSNRGIESDDLEIVTDDGFTLRGWHLKNPNSKRIIVYFQGNAGNIGTRLPFAQHLMEHTNSDVIMVAYRGYSDSDGSPTQKGIEKDSQKILQKALEIANQARKRLYVFGTSLGGAVTIYASGTPNIRQKISGIIVENTFTSTTDVLPHHAPFIRPLIPFIRLVNRNSWESINRISLIQRPILFIKCGRDQVVPSIMTDKLREECKKKHKTNYLFELPDGLHNDVHVADPVRYFMQLKEFFGYCEK